MAGRDWTLQEVREAEALIRTGANPGDVARKLGRTRNALVLALRANGTSVTGLQAERREMVLDTIRAGADPKAAAKQFGLRHRLVLRWMQKAGISRPSGRPRRFPDEVALGWMILHLNGETYKDIAASWGLPMTTVRSTILRYRDKIKLPTLGDERTLEGRAARTQRKTRGEGSLDSEAA